MIIPGSVNPLLAYKSAGATQYLVERSLRFNKSDSAYLSRTFGTPTNQNTFTFSFWVKRGSIATGAGQAKELIAIDSNNFLQFEGAGNLNLETTGTGRLLSKGPFIDAMSWYHIVLVNDNQNGTLYVNNFVADSSSATFASSSFNGNGITHRIGGFTNFFDGYMAELHFVDGQALTPSSFAETDATTGQWVPKLYSGSYGNNGYKLTFSDNSNTTSATLGKDTSGNNNDWTPTGFSVTAGVGNDSLTDTPTSYGTGSAGGDVRGNFAVLNPNDHLTTVTPINGNLEHSSTTVGQNALGSIGVSSGKWYWEVVTTGGTTQTRVGVYNTAASTLYSLAADSTVYGIRFDADAGTLDRTTNGTTWTSIATGLTSGPYFPYFNNNGSTVKTVSVNFGQRAWSYPAPTGYQALCDTNLPTPSIIKSADAFEAIIYTGNGSTLTPTSSLNFSPDLVWIKKRNPSDHQIFDTTRGAQVVLVSNSISTESTVSTTLTSFNSNGFTVGSDSDVNANGNSHAAWLWNEGASSGFDVVSYTGNGSNRTIAHSLNTTPGMIIVKARSASGNWTIWHTALGNDGYLAFSTPASATSTTVWNSTLPTSSVFSLGTSTLVNTNAVDYIAYLWSEIAGFSKIGSYTGNNSGQFIYTGFKPRWIVVKIYSGGTGSWIVVNSAVDRFNIAEDALLLNTTTGTSATSISFLSNGFRLSTTLNASSDLYVYMAFAENPFKYARAF